MARKKTNKKKASSWKGPEPEPEPKAQKRMGNVKFNSANPAKSK